MFLNKNECSETSAVFYEENGVFVQKLVFLKSIHTSELDKTQ